MWYGLICTLWYVSEYLSWKENVYLLILGKKYCYIKSRQKVVVTWHVTESALNLNVYSVTFIKKVLLFVVCICWVLGELSKSREISPPILTCRGYFRFHIRFRRGPVGGFITQPAPPEFARWLSGTPPCRYFPWFIPAPILWNLGAGCRNYNSIPKITRNVIFLN